MIVITQIFVLFSVIDCYRHYFWIETNDEPLTEVHKNKVQHLNFEEKYWFELNEEVYIFTCSLNIENNFFTCLLIRQNDLLQYDLGILSQPRFSVTFDISDSFFKIASFWIERKIATYYNLSAMIRKKVLKGSFVYSLSGLNAQFTQKLNLVKRKQSFPNEFYWHIEKRFELLQKDELHCAVYAEYLFIDSCGDSEERFSMSEVILMKTLCSNQCTWPGTKQMVQVSMLEEIVVQKGFNGDKHVYGLPHNTYPILQVCFKPDRLSPVFEIYSTVVEPIQERDDLQKLTFVGTKTYLALDRETQVPKWRVTLPIFYNDFGQPNAEVLVFMVFFAIDQTENGYRDFAFEKLSFTTNTQKIYSKYGKIYFKVSVNQTDENLSIDLLMSKEKVNKENSLYYEVKCEKPKKKDLDREMFSTDFVKYFNGTIISANKLKKVSEYSSKEKTIKGSSNINSKTKALLLVFFCFGTLVSLVFVGLVVSRKNKMKKLRKKHRKN